MKVESLEAAVKRRPFRSFEIRIDGEVLIVTHPEPVLFSEEKTTAVVADREDHIHIFDFDQISKIRFMAGRKTSS